MDRHLIDYLPPILRAISEFQAINNANEPEIKAAWDALARVMANQFIDSADEMGVSEWETQLKIFPKGTDTMDMRKARIKAIWNRDLPYTLTWFKSWLDGVCVGDCSIKLDKDAYTLTIITHFKRKSDTADIQNFVNSIIPANMNVVYINNVAIKSRAPVYTACRTVAYRKHLRVEVKKYGLE